MAFKFRQLQYFVAVAEMGSISGAARQLSVAQSAVTEAVQELESDLGTTLLDRSGRGVALTHKGQQFLRHASRILAAVADARRTFTDAEAPAGELHLGASSLVAGYILADLIARFRRAFPMITVAAVEDGAEYLEHAAGTRRGITYRRFR
jgi:molybdate transport repressor ModE-like protein